MQLSLGTITGMKYGESLNIRNQKRSTPTSFFWTWQQFLLNWWFAIRRLDYQWLPLSFKLLPCSIGGVQPGPFRKNRTVSAEPADNSYFNSFFITSPVCSQSFWNWCPHALGRPDLIRDQQTCGHSLPVNTAKGMHTPHRCRGSRSMRCYLGKASAAIGDEGWMSTTHQRCHRGIYKGLHRVYTSSIE